MGADPISWRGGAKRVGRTEGIITSISSSSECDGDDAAKNARLRAGWAQADDGRRTDRISVRPAELQPEAVEIQWDGVGIVTNQSLQHKVRPITVLAE